MRPLNVMLAAAAAASLLPAAPARADARDVLLAYAMWDAERDFDAVRVENALSGSAPLAGLKQESKPVKKESGRKAKSDRVRTSSKAAPTTRATALDVKPTLTRP